MLTFKILLVWDISLVGNLEVFKRVNQRKITPWKAKVSLLVNHQLDALSLMYLFTLPYMF
jgi:hypothetical protein